MTAPRSEVRSDIQGLRAIAVLMVVLFHFFPAALPGGYAGVDVFFVISGFLITSHLLREQAGGRISLPEFWARRARRLLPAALLVILITAAALWLWAPQSRWQDSALQAGAATFYILNWFLAANAVDYLAATNDPTAFEHYWSLSVEEQFYLVWPVLLVLAALFTRGSGPRFRRAAFGVIAALTAGSLAYCIWITATDPAAAYFVTPARAWEFGLGGLLGLLPAAGPAVLRAAVGWAGVAAILGTAFGYTSATPFPGYAALLPALGAAAVIWAGPSRAAWSVDRLARFRPVQFLGDVSYSLYLWHWPLVVVIPYVIGAAMPWWLALLAVGASIVLAWATKRWVEDPVRRARWLTTARARRSLLGTLAAMVVVAILPGALYLENRSVTTQATRAFSHHLSAGTDCLGAKTMVEPGCDAPPLGDAVFPAPSNLLTNTGGAYGCYSSQPSGGRIRTCDYGSTRPDAVRVAITGDSHAAMVLLALRPYLEDLNWRVTSYLGRGPCTNWMQREAVDPCAELASWEAGQFESGGYSIVIAAGLRDDDAAAAQRDAARRAAAWSAAIDNGVTVLAIQDNPHVPEELWERCTSYSDIRTGMGAACTPTVAAAVTGRPDSIELAAQLVPEARFVAVDDLYCDANSCPLVIGNVIVYRDGHHPTAAWIRTMAPYLLDRIERALAAP